MIVPGVVRKLTIRRKNQRAQGFTLIELIIAVALIAIIVAISLAGFRNYASQQTAQTFTTSIYDLVFQAKQQSQTAVGNGQYGIYVGPTSIELFPGSTPTPGDPNNKIVTVPGTFTATSSFASGEAYTTFTRLTGVPAATGTIALVNVATGGTTTIRVGAGGTIAVE